MCSLDDSRMRDQRHVGQRHVFHECPCRCLRAAKAGDLQFLQLRAHLRWLKGFPLEGISHSAAECRRMPPCGCAAVGMG